MPALCALGRLWCLADDDLVLPGASGAVLLTAWTGLLGASSRLAATCAPTAFTRFILGLLCLTAANTLLHVLLAICSARGG